MCYWEKPGRSKDVPAIRFPQRQRSASQVLLSEVQKFEKEKDDRNQQCRLRNRLRKKNCEVCGLSQQYLRTKRESAGVWKLDQGKQVESRRLCSSVSWCCFSHRVLVYVLCDPAISVPWETWRSILTPHLLWPLSHPYRSPSPPHWCIFISIVTWLFKGSLA